MEYYLSATKITDENTQSIAMWMVLESLMLSVVRKSETNAEWFILYAGI